MLRLMERQGHEWIAAAQGTREQDAINPLKHEAESGVFNEGERKMEVSSERPSNTNPVVPVTKQAFNDQVITLRQWDAGGEVVAWLHYPGNGGGQVLSKKYREDPEALRRALLEWLKAHLVAAGVKIEART